MDARNHENISQKRQSNAKNKSFKSSQDAVAKFDQVDHCADEVKVSGGDLDHAPNSFMSTSQSFNIHQKNDKLNVGAEFKKNEPNFSTLEHKKNTSNNYSSEIIKKSLKSREEILADREAKKLAKQALKSKIKETCLNKADKVHILNLKKIQNIEVKKDTSKEKIESSLYGGEENSKKIVEKYKCDEGKALGSPVEVSKEPAPSLGAENARKSEDKTKAQLRAERRDKQEAQRAKKLEKMKILTEEKVSPVPQKSKIVKSEIKDIKMLEKSQDKIHKVKLFAHLYSSLFDCIELNVCEDLHPSIVQLGTQYRSKVISGANARCLALLNALKTVIQDYQTPPNQEFSRGLEAEISKSISFLNKCRPVAVSMVNAVKHLKFQVNQLSGNEIESKKQINEWIDTYIKEQIEKAAEAITLFVLQKISDNDVILIYSCSSLIKRILIKANKAKIKFRVIVVDGRPWLEGKEMLRKLVRAGIRCTYVFFNGLSFIMPEVTKILLSAHALLANGYVMSRAGSSQIALMAKAYNVPVLVCCETHKFSEKVQTDSFVYNELGEPYELVSKNKCSEDSSKWKALQYLTPLNLTYDVTPPDLVSAVVTEIAVLPCTSVPVILRIKPPDIIC